MARMTSTATSRGVTPEARQHMIGEAAYYRSSRRGFVPGHELDDWLAAEADIERASFRQQPPEPDTVEEYGMQQGGPLGRAEDEALKRIIRQHPRRDIPRIESIEPEDAPLKE